MSECISILKANPSLQIPGFTASEAARALCKAVEFSGSMSIESVTKARTSRWPTLNKAVEGEDLQHVVSVDNGAAYAELWFKGGNWYAVTSKSDGITTASTKVKKSEGPSIYFIDTVTKGMGIDDASQRFMSAIFTPKTLKKSGGCGCNDR